MKLCLQRRQLKFPMIGHPTNLFCCADVAALLLLGWPILQTPYYIMLLWLLVLVCPCATDTICPMWPIVRLVHFNSLFVCSCYLCVFSVIVNLVLPDCWLLIFGSFGCGCALLLSSILQMVIMNRNWNILCCNVRGINLQAKWDALRNKIDESSCAIVCIQETKRDSFDASYIRNFAPRRLDKF